MTTGSRQRYLPPSASRFFLTFGYAWLTIGLFMGTLVLVVAVRGILSMIQRMGWGQAAQNRLLIVVILVFIISSFLLARRVVRMLYRQKPATRKVWLALLGVPALLSAYAWTNPARFLSGMAGTQLSSVAMRGGPNFVFGSYPDENRLKELKKQGVTAVISLQSPKVLVEIEGIRAERDAAAREHLPFIEAPMLPWVSDNEDAIAKIKQIALHGSGTYYVHCGLGRDRVNIVKRVIESLQPQSNAKVTASTDLKKAVGFNRRIEPFERGMLMKVADGVWVVPFPNKEEFYGFIIQGDPGHVLLVLNPNDPSQRAWITEAERQMKEYAVAYTVIPYPGASGDTSTAPIVAKMRTMKPPYTVIVPRTTFELGDPIDPVARAIGRAYNVKVVAPSKVVERTAGETPDLVAPPKP